MLSSKRYFHLKWRRKGSKVRVMYFQNGGEFSKNFGKIGKCSRLAPKL